MFIKFIIKEEACISDKKEDETGSKITQDKLFSQHSISTDKPVSPLIAI